MSTASRKARKRAGVAFTKAQKVPTPVEERSSTMAEGRRMIRQVMSALRARLGTDPTDEQVAAELKRLADVADGVAK